jgi:hypothetical protein
LQAIQDRIVYVDPRTPPAINLFDLGGEFDAFLWLFSALLQQDLTGKQTTFLRFLIALMQQLPAATVHDLIAATVDPGAYQEYIDQLPETHRQFFRDDFPKTYGDTRAQVRTRLQGIVADPVLNNVLNSSHTDIDVGAALNGKVLLIDTQKDILKGASAPLGQVFIFLILQALFARASIPEKHRYPVMLIVDEAHEYVSNESQIDLLLNQARKFACSVTLAFQNLTQASADLRATLMSSTSIKACSQVSYADATTFAKNMGRTPVDFVAEQPSLHFAVYVRGETPQALSIQVTPGLLDREETVDVASYDEPKPKESPPRHKSGIHDTHREGKSAATPSNPDESDTGASGTW